MKVLFLDVDGVLNTFNNISIYALSNPLVSNLDKVVKETGCEIVLSSTWRKFEDHLFTLNRKLGYYGITIFSHTNQLGGKRGEEIQEWLDHHPEVMQYAIVDDDSDMLDHQLPNFFQTDPHYGLTETIKYRIIHHLNKGDASE